jgi:Na+/H+-dicarboxylate symporter
MTSFLVEFSSGVVLFIAGLLGFIVFSNTLVTFYSYGVYSILHPLVIDTHTSVPVLNLQSSIKPLFGLPIKKIVDNNVALLFGLICGIVLALKPTSYITEWLKKARETCIFILRKTLTPLVPLFIFGFMLKLQKDDILEQMIAVYSKVFLITLMAMITYIIGMYVVLAKGNLFKAIRYIKDFFPAALTAFSTMSSMAAYPVTLECAQQTSNHPRLTQGILTSTVNIHLMGVGIAIPILAITVSMYFGHPFPSLGTYSIFAFYLILAKFSVAAIPAGSIIVAVHVLQDHFGFTSEMSALIMSLYMLVDPFSTATNVLGNGAFSLLMTHVFAPLFKANARKA